MPDLTNNLNALSKGVTDFARDAAYVAVGLGVLAYQRAQVQRVELTNRLSHDFDIDLDKRIEDVRGGWRRASTSWTSWPRPPLSSWRPRSSPSRTSSPDRVPADHQGPSAGPRGALADPSARQHLTRMSLRTSHPTLAVSPLPTRKGRRRASSRGGWWAPNRWWRAAAGRRRVAPGRPPGAGGLDPSRA